VATPVQERLRARSLTQRVPAAGSQWVAKHLAASPLEVPVIAAGPHAVYLGVAGPCLAVLDAHAIPVPLGLRTVLHRLPRVRTAVVGDGCVRLGPRPPADPVGSRTIAPWGDWGNARRSSPVPEGVP